MANIDTTLNDVFKSTALGDLRSAIGATLYGINHRQTPNAVPINQDGVGLTFMTRPQLNLTSDNLRALRSMIPLLTTNELSYSRMVRVLLDPRLDLPCPIVNKKNAFIPLLTNHMLSCSGWPDPYIETRTSKPGVYKEVFTQVDSTINQYSAMTISASFRNMTGDPISLLFYIWIQYMAGLVRGDLSPYPDMIALNEIDYNTRIWRLVLDRSKRYVQKIACTGASLPQSVSLGKSFDFESDKPINAGNDTISIQFPSDGYCYQDEILVYEFNQVVSLFHPSMSDSQRPYDMVLLTQAQLPIFNNRGYPHIDINTKELQWYVDSGEFISIMGAYTRNFQTLSGQPGAASPVTYPARPVV